MRRIAVLSLAALLAASAARGQRPFARADLSPRSVTVGEPVTLTLDVFSPTWFPSAPEFPTIDVKDAIVVADERNVNLNETVDGTTFFGVRQEYRIYPQRPGRYEIPPIAFSVVYAVDAKPSPPTPVSAGTPGFSATVPDAAKGLDYFVATPSFHVSATADRKTADLKVGDSLTRTITMTAEDAFAMMLPPLSFAPIDGLAVYPGQPVTSDTGGEHGEARVGRRVETVTYVMQKAGKYELPAVEISWWDTKAKALRKAMVPALAFTVASNPNRKDEIPLPGEAAAAAAGSSESAALSWRIWVRDHWPWLAAGLGALVLLWRAATVRIRRRRESAKREPVEPPEPVFFRQVEAAAAKGDPAALLAATYRWLDRRAGGPSAARLDVFARESGIVDLVPLAAGLEDRVCVREGKTASAWSAREFLDALSRARGRRPAVSVPPELPPLNPPAA